MKTHRSTLSNAEVGYVEVDERTTYNTSLFAIPPSFVEYLENVMLPHGLIQSRVEKLANDIIADAPEELVVLCVLKGAHQFFADLMQHLKKCNQHGKRIQKLNFEFIRLKSYVGDQSSGNVSVSGLEFSTIKDKNVLIVEDIVDTGRSAVKLVDELKKFSPRSIKFVSLLLKRIEKMVFFPDYIGFEIPNAFVIGYCLDYNEHFRELDHICVLNDKGKQHFSEA